MVNARQAKTAREKAAEMRAEAARKQARSRNTAIIAVIVTVIAIAVGAGILVKTLKHSQDVKTAAATAPPANLTNGGFLVGKADAKVTVLVFEDFICPACQAFEQAHNAELTAMVTAGTIKIEYHPIAFLDGSSTTTYSTRALNAAGAVINADPAAFVKFHGLLFANQPAEGSAGLTDEQLIQYAVQAGVQRGAVEPAITSLKYVGWTQTQTQAFVQKWNVKGRSHTPTVVVNGKEVTDPISGDGFTKAVQTAAKG